MKEFLILLGQIFLIACLQTLAEMFIDKDEKPYQSRLLNIACFAGSLYLLAQFIFEHLMPELAGIINLPF